MKYSRLAAPICLLLAFARAQAEVDPKNFDPATKPQDDFYQYANGAWLKANPVPPEYSYWGVDNEVDNRNKAILKSILERASTATAPGPIEKKVGDFFASGMNEAAIESAGLTPLQPELDRIAALPDVAHLPSALARLHRLEAFPGFYFSSEADPGDSSRKIAGVMQSGLGLPDRDYYFRDDDKSKKIREQYVAHVAKMFELAGEPAAAAQAHAQTVLKLETALAQGSKTRVALRDPVANYHKMPPADVQKLTPHFDWSQYYDGLGIATPKEIDVGQPEFFQALDAEIAAVPLEDWKTYLRWHLLHSAAPYLNSPFENEDFAFYGQTMTGAKQLHERWRRVLTTIDHNAGEALGQLYVAEAFPPESKARVLALVGNLRAALREDLQTIDWMDEPTRAAALNKLDNFNVKIGYPDKWIDYGNLAVDRGPYVLNVLRAREFDSHRELAKIDQPTDRGEWEMTPPTVNAYFEPSLNEIVFPAGILQPPFFDPKADDAVNYGAIGSVIGHELTHGYDDEGRQYDAHGNLKDWWTPESAKRFEERAAKIVQQFNNYVAVDDLHINGELTEGENIADLGGLKIAFAAFQKSRAGQPRELIAGLTPEQRFFLSYASSWRENSRPEALRRLVLTNPHSPAPFRVNGPVSNLPEFAQAFGIPEGAPMRRPPAEQVNIW